MALFSTFGRFLPEFCITAMPRTRPKALLQLIVLFLLVACSEQQDLETVSRCYPADACGSLQYGSQPLVFTATGGDPNNGQTLYQQRCTSCHGVDGKGTGQVGQGDFTDPNWHTRFTDNQIRLTVRHGRGMAMPAAPLADDKMRDLIAYLRTMAPNLPSTGEAYP